VARNESGHYRMVGNKGLEMIHGSELPDAQVRLRSKLPTLIMSEIGCKFLAKSGLEVRFSSGT